MSTMLIASGKHHEVFEPVERVAPRRNPCGAARCSAVWLAASCLLLGAASNRAPAGDLKLQQVLQLYEFDESRWRTLVDGQPWSEQEREPLYRVLYVLPRLDAADVQRWQRTARDWSQLAQQPDEFRGQLFDVRGEVLGLEEIQLPAESADRFRYAACFQVTLRSDGDAHPRVVYSREVPRWWREHAPSRNSPWKASCPALFLKRGTGQPGAEALVFAAAHVAWHPQQPDPAQGVTAGMALLGSAGVDVGLLSGFAQARPLGHEDRECFYQMLWAAGRVDAARLPADLPAPATIDRLLQHPETSAGELLTLVGTARRALRIEVTDPDVRQRFGIGHYYELHVFLPLPQSLRLTNADDGKVHTYGSFPVTVCLRQLPPDVPEGSEIRQTVQVTGWFMKLWSYRSQGMDPAESGLGAGASAARRQISPLLIGIRAQAVSAPPPSHPALGLMLAGSFLAGVALLGFAARWYRRSDRSFAQWKRQRLPDRAAPDPPPADSSAAP